MKKWPRRPAAARVRAWAGIIDGEPEADGGYAAVDALVALTILTMTLGMAISAGDAAERAGAAAKESDRAADLFEYLTSQPPVIGLQQGLTADFAWREAVTPLATPSPQGELHLCARHLQATSGRSGRHFDLEGQVLCVERAP